MPEARERSSSGMPCILSKSLLLVCEALPRLLPLLPRGLSLQLSSYAAPLIVSISWEQPVAKPGMSHRCSTRCTLSTAGAYMQGPAHTAIPAAQSAPPNLHLPSMFESSPPVYTALWPTAT